MRKFPVSVFLMSGILVFGVMIGMNGQTPAPAPAAIPTLVATPPQPAAQLDPGATTIQEDDPAWNCATDGNKVCGTQVVNAAASSPTKTCHSAYDVQEHFVPEHIVKATSAHSQYTVYGHTVAAHTVKANC